MRPATRCAWSVGTSEGGVPADALDLDWLNDTCPQLGDAQTVCGSTTEDGPILFDAERRASCQVAWDGGPDAPMSASSLELSGEVLYGCTQASNDGVLYRADLVTGEIELTFQPCRGVRTTPCGLLLDQTVDPLPDDQDSRLVLFSSFEDARCNEGGRAIRHLSTRHGAFDVRGSTVTLWDERQDQLVDGNLFGGVRPGGSVAPGRHRRVHGLQRDGQRVVGRGRLSARSSPTTLLVPRG
jgi:hypothetical protein